ncbi:MAG TPA: N-acetylmuramoyl-L-alanine amidase [Spirochaetota bacterium]|nr:N-acetylmuramoyl-L-alanine amidase [Spirochaetota bacterium]HQJ70948.1 N-acetylmuramoyl-L-alanine amidase [Spirochaetota bacterium]HRS77835.1 N-acetylmuramoyl-L-alanine amidase [Spirochaetota bacterium]HRT75433.1 N-acetylmuramoyl-L-alanine amidase [Spirochaetota bacterium]
MSGHTRGIIVKKKTRIVQLVALFICIAAPALPSSESITIIRVDGGEYLPLDEMLPRCGIEHSFDMVAQKGKLYRKNHYAVYGVGLPIVLIDGSLYKSSAAVRRQGGRVLLPLDTGQEVVRSLNPELGLARRGDALVVERRGGETVPDQKIEKRRPGPRDRISFIVIDAGHGGKDPGAVGKGGLREKDITLRVARLLEKRIRTRLAGVRVYMTRGDDRFIELSARTVIANRLLKKNENGIFLSIHVNSSLSSRISGHETFFLSQNPTNEEARNTAALENNVVVLEDRTKGKSGHDDVDYIEAMMITTQIQKESSALAASVQEGMAKKNRVFSSRGVKKADFYVLRGVLMPAALVEIGYISNAKEAGYLKKDSHREAVAEGISQGVELFIKNYNSLIRVN